MPQTEAQTNPGEESGNKWLALIAVILGAFVAVLNNSLINIALPKLTAIFGSTTEKMQWVLTGYMLASAVVIPMSGYMGDRFGYKKVFIFTLGFFTMSSAFCGMAWNDSSLIAFRIVQGLSGGFIMPLSMSIIYMIMPRAQIGMALGLWGIAAMAAPALGPTLSGYIVEYFTWRILFFMIVPIGIFALFMMSIMLKETPKKEGLQFDLPGAVLSVIMFGTLLLALSKGQSEGWTSFYIVGLLFTAAASGMLLVWVETGKESPMLDLRFLKNPIFALSTLTSGLVSIGMFGGIFLTPIYLQNIQGLSALDTGLLLMPQSIAMALMMPVSGKLFDKFGVVPLAFTGLSILAVTTYGLHMLTGDTPNGWLRTVLTIRGLGIGLCMMPLTTAGMNVIPKMQVGRASSLSNVLRQVMGSLGIAVLTTIMTQRQVFHASRISESVVIGSNSVSQAIDTISKGLAQFGADMGTAQSGATVMLAGMIQKEALIRAIADTFIVSSFPLFATIPLIFFFAQKKEKKQVGNESSKKPSPPQQPLKQEEVRV